MKEISGFNLLKIIKPSMAGNELSVGLVKDVNNSGQSFSGILTEQINSIKNDSIVQNENSIDRKSDNKKSEEQKTGFGTEEKLIDNRINFRDEKIVDLHTRDADSQVNNSAKETVNSDEVKPKDHKNNIQKDNKVTVNRENNLIKKASEDKPEKINPEEIKAIVIYLEHILNMLKGLMPDKKLEEIKSSLLNLKRSLEAVNSGQSKNRAVVFKEGEIKNLFEQLKDLVKSLDERVEKGFLNKNKDIKTAKVNISENPDRKEFKQEPVNLNDLKKQITKVTEEVRQLLNNKKSENTAGKFDEISNENKNSFNNKVVPEFFKAEKNEGSQARDNSSTYNFSSFKRDIDNPNSSQRNTPAGIHKNNVFNEQLNDVLQNAKIVVRDSKNGSFTMRLHPESLGRVNVNLNLEQGVIVGKFLVDSTEAKEAMLENIQSITNKLRQDGIAVGEFHVNVRDDQKPYYNDDYSGKKITYNNALKASPAGIEYEMNSLYSHNGEIDLLI